MHEETKAGFLSEEAQAIELAQKPDLAPALRQETVSKEDGRYLIYYTFELEAPVQQAEEQVKNV